MQQRTKTYLLVIGAITILLFSAVVMIRNLRENTKLLDEIATTQLKLSSYSTRLTKAIQHNQAKTIEALVMRDESLEKSIKTSTDEIVSTIKQLSRCIERHRQMLPTQVLDVIKILNSRLIAYENMENSVLQATKNKRLEDLQDALVGFNATAAAFSNDVLLLVDLTNKLLQYKITQLQQHNEQTNRFLYTSYFFVTLLLLLSLYLMQRYQKKMIQQLHRAEKAEKETRLLSQRLQNYSQELEIEIAKKENELYEKIYTNPISGLPNRYKLLQQMQNNEFKYLALLNIDNFQKFNDVYGENIGNEALKATAAFLQDILPNKHALYHLGGDEYAIAAFYDSPIAKDQFLENIRQILKAFRKKEFHIKNSKYTLSMSAGISFGGLQKILAYADMALKDAKKKSTYIEIYQGKELESKHKEDLRCYQKLLDALQHKRIVPFLQPLLPLQNPNLPIKYESLVRLVDKEGKAIPPINFLRIAKQNRVYHKITGTMIKQTFALIEKYNLFLSINLSMADITNEKTKRMIFEKLENFEACEKITFELLETEDFEDYSSVYEFCIQAKSYGVSLALDDFGSGYSNFSHIIHLPVDYIKIDASLVSNVARDHASQLMIEMIVLLAKKIGVKTVAEFVSSKEIMELVMQLGVDYAQGFYLGRPEPVEYYLKHPPALPARGDKAEGMNI